MTKFNCFITGDDYKTLVNETLSSRKKINLLASTLWIPVVMWFCSTFLLCRNVLEIQMFMAVIAAVFVSSLIFMIERSIIMSNGSRLLYAFRIILGFLVASLGSLALDEVLFKNDIDIQMAEMKNELILENSRKVENEQLSNLNYLRKDKEAKFVAWQKASAKAQQEADGTGGSGQRGVSAITKLKLQQAAYLKSVYDLSLNKFNEFSVNLDAEKANSKQYIAGSFRENSLLMRIKAMFHLIFSDIAMLIVYFLITVFLFALEFIVVILKVTSQKTAYERKIEAIETIAAQKLQSMIAYESNHFRPENLDKKVIEAKGILNQKMSSIFN